MLEKRHEPLLPAGKFALRVACFAGASGLLIAAALGLGIAGYHWIAGFAFADALLNASMILAGMGPVGELHTTAAKVFASAYALFSGLIFITAAGVLLAPVLHRIVHRFHLDR